MATAEPWTFALPPTPPVGFTDELPPMPPVALDVTVALVTPITIAFDEALPPAPFVPPVPPVQAAAAGYASASPMIQRIDASTGK